jgi:hypothetical protein
MNQMKVTRAMLALLVLGAVALPAGAGLEELARSGQWEQLVRVAERRSGQLPLRADEAFIAAVAARTIGDRGVQRQYLLQAAVEGPFDELARLELAEVTVVDDAARALELVLPMVRRAPTRAMREQYRICRLL